MRVSQQGIENRFVFVIFMLNPKYVFERNPLETLFIPRGGSL